MKRLSFTSFFPLLVLFLFYSLSISAQQITESVATQKAADHLGVKDVHLVHAVNSGDTPLLYIFNANKEKKFAIVAATENVRNVILAYSLNDSIDWNHAPEPFIRTVQNYAKGILKVGIEQNSRSKVVSKVQKVSDNLPASVDPLVTAEWNQGTPYNLLCPTIDGDHCLTGCVQTAMAMMMYYHKWPKQPTGLLSYEWNGQTLSTNLSDHAYNWDVMSPQYDNKSSDESKNAVAQLMYDLGVANTASYGLDATGAAVNTTRFIENFNFDHDMQIIYLESCNTDYLENLLRMELSSSRPVLVGGGGPNGAHEFICDGYDSNGYFHFNFGWGGYANGYFLVTATGYDSYPSYIYNIKPEAGGTGKLSLMSEGDFMYKDTGIACDLTARCLADTKYEKPIEISIAIKNTDTGAITYQTVNTVKGTKWIVADKLTFSISPEDGRYVVYPVARLNGGEWQEFVCSDKYQGSIDLTVESGRLTFENNGIKDPIDEGTTEIDNIYYKLNSSTLTASVTYRNDRKNSYKGNVIVPATVSYNGQEYKVTSIGAYAFESSTELESVYVGSNVKTIEYAAFSQSSLKEVTFDPNSSLTSIGGWGFNFTQLTDVVLPKGVKSIGSCAFQSLTLKRLSIPSSVTVMSSQAVNALLLNEIDVFWATPSEFDEDIITYTDHSDLSKCTLYVPKGTSDAYKATIPWKTFNIVETTEEPELEEITIDVTTPGTLKSLLGDTDYTKITVRGDINGEDIRELRARCQCNDIGYSTSAISLKSLDISDANIVDGGVYMVEESWNGEMRESICKADVFGEHMFQDSSTGILEELIMPKTVKSMEHCCIQQNKMHKLVLPEQLESYNNAIIYCKKLSKPLELIVPEQCQLIYEDKILYSKGRNEICFVNNSFTKLILDSRATSIQSDAIQSPVCYIDTLIYPSQKRPTDDFCAKVVWLGRNVDYLRSSSAVGAYCRTLFITSPKIVEWYAYFAEYAKYETIYVPQNLLDTYKTDSQWSQLGNVFKALEDVDICLDDRHLLPIEDREAKVGESISITPCIVDTKLYSSPVTFNSSDTSVATIDSNGTITCLGEGTTTITVNVDKYSTQFTVTVIYDESLDIESLPAANRRAMGQYIYNMSGQRVGKDYHGIVIQDGKKILR